MVRRTAIATKDKSVRRHSRIPTTSDVHHNNVSTVMAHGIEACFNRRRSLGISHQGIRERKEY